MLTMGGDIQVGVEQPIGTFFDGTNTYIRYRKVIDFGVLPNGTYREIDLNTNFVGILQINLVSRNPTSNSAFPITFLNSGNNMVIPQILNGNKFRITTVGDFSSYSKTLITIEYYR